MFIAKIHQHFFLADTKFELQAGDIISLAGGSGSGKSLLLRALADIDPCQRELSLDHVGCDTMPAHHWRRQVMWFPSQPSWWQPQMSAHFHFNKNLYTLLNQFFKPQSEALWQAWLQRPVSQFSSGEKQRLGLIRGMAQQPRVLLLDEPTANLDYEHARQSLSVIQDYINQFNAGALLVSHQRELANCFCTRFFTLSNGCLKESP